ncbi:eukaryotic translation initiation factor 4E transporter-like [Macrobrachium rosenbergii]|uniref:eukaryotic translation initiation factor 4E transporter-like n=1 Tax=Macrobrachium rosenbergii TaxID=79674 RepID=UPI0034D3FE9D
MGTPIRNPYVDTVREQGTPTEQCCLKAENQPEDPSTSSNGTTPQRAMPRSWTKDRSWVGGSLVQGREESILVSTVGDNLNGNTHLLNWERFSKVKKVYMTTAWILRFLNNCRSSTSMKRHGELTLEELQEAKNKTIAIIQREFFQEEYKSLMKGVRKPKLALVHQLNLYLGYLGNSNKVRMQARPYRPNVVPPLPEFRQEEQDGLVLSPQRRSFSTGCHGLQQGSPLSNRPDSPVERSHPQRESHREIPARRIGSGRISRRDDIDVPVSGERREIGRRERDLERDREVDQRRDSRDWRSKPDQRYDREERFDSRRRFFEEEEAEPKRANHRDRERRYQDRKRVASRNEEEEQPEWFTGGPTSQNEFIELVGFDDIPEEGSTSGKPQSKRERRRSKKDRDGGGSRKSSRSNTPVIIEETVDRKSPKEEENDHQNADEEREQLQPQWTKPMVVEPTNDQEMPDFNIDEFLEDIIGFQGEWKMVLRCGSNTWFGKRNPQGSCV